MKVTNMLAKAQFDNKADSPDELTFRKGDILTVLEQNIPGSEGWWRCYLHGRQGLVPANRLQLFTITKNDASSAQTHYGTLGRQQSQQNIYQVPSAPKITNLPTYEQMDSVYIVPLSPKSGDLYQTPVSSPAQIYYEKANSTTSQHLFTLPRASRVSNPASVAQAEVYDVPPSVHSTPPSHQSSAAPSPVGLHSPFSTSPEQTQQQIYDIPASTDTPGRRGLTEIYDIPPSGKALQDKKEASLKGCYYNTLPPPRKSDWIYDVPVSPEKKDIKTCRKISLDRQMVYDVPPTRYGTLQTNSEDTCVTSQIYNVPPLQKTSPVACQPVYDIPPSLDLGYGSMKKNTSNIWKQRVEKLDSKENVYDIPRGSTGASLSKTEMASPASDKPIYEVPPPLPRYRNASLISAEIDRLSISSSESCTSTLSSSSSASDESFTMSSLEVSIKQETLELDEAIKEITQLQDRLSSSIASLMIFVSSKWRLQEHMVANLEDIHKAVDSIIASLKAFLDFAQRIRANASQLKDSNIQLRIKTQLQTLTDSFQMLSHNQEAIDRCNWSMQALVIDKPHTTPDDLDRFVMVARTIPDDIKRFVSIIIANGKLLFRKREEQIKLKEEIMLPKPQVLPQKETDVGQQSACVNKAENARQRKHPLPRQKTIEDSDYVHLQKKEEFERAKSIFSHQQLENTTKTEEKRKGWIKPERVISGSEKQEKKDKLLTTKEPSTLTPKQDTSHSPESPKKFSLSEHSCLYFGALQKAIGVFNNSLNNNQPPEIFITHGKLIIMVGQKLVDSVCQDVKTSEVRNDVLFKSSELCGLLKNLALATKTAAIQYPNPAALRDMEMRMDQLLKHTQIFRAMAE